MLEEIQMINDSKLGTKSNGKYHTSSCYFLDLRNSTRIIRELSLEDGTSTRETRKNLKKHAEFMIDIHRQLENKLNCMSANNKKLEYFFNDTGDGHMCLFWDEAHAWRALDLACHIYVYLHSNKKLEKHNEWIKKVLKKGELQLGFGIGLHTGGSVVYEKKAFGRDYAFGIAINSAARMESFTKLFKKLKFLFSGYLCNFLKKQFANITINNVTNFDDLLNKQLVLVVEQKADIKDERPSGHKLWTIKKPDFFSGKIHYIF